MTNEIPDSFESIIVRAIEQDYFFCFIVTSKTQALLPSDQVSFGGGKTTNLLQWMVRANHDHYKEILLGEGDWVGWQPSGDADAPEWNMVFERLAYNPIDVRDNFLNTRKKRANMCGWDDVQVTAPRVKGVPKFLTLLKGEITAARPEIATLGMSTPNRNGIAAPLREMPDFEVIIPSRAKYEVQHTVMHKIFDDPERDAGFLRPVETGHFDDLPPLVKARYVEWRTLQKEYLKTRDYQLRMRKLNREADAFVEELAKGENPIVQRRKEQLEAKVNFFTQDWLAKTLREGGLKAPQGDLNAVCKKIKDAFVEKYS